MSVVRDQDRTTIPKAAYPRIIERYLAGESTYAISKDFNVSRNAIRQVLLLSCTPIRSKSSAAKLRVERETNRRAHE